MGTCCQAHLATMIRDFALNAQNGAVTTTIIENPKVTETYKDGKLWSHFGFCDYCKAPAEFNVTYYPKTGR